MLLYQTFLTSDDKENEELAFQITGLFRAFRKTIAVNKDAIHNTKIYFKNPALRVKEITAQAKVFYSEMTGKKYPEDKSSKAGKVRYLLEKSVRNVIFSIGSGVSNLNWEGDNKYVSKWDGKLLPARFANRVAKQFNILTNRKFSIKLTTSHKLLVNKNNKPDTWESQIIDTHLINTSKDDFVTKSTTTKGYFRYMLPEFYGTGCIGCHGTDNGQEGYDIHPSKIKRKLNDFAGAISISFKVEN